VAVASTCFWFTPVGLNSYVNRITLQLTFDSPQILTQFGFIDSPPALDGSTPLAVFEDVVRERIETQQAKPGG
jgi:hypothetical protein